MALSFHLFFLASPIHVVGGSHPQMVQPSKVLSLLPRPSGNQGLVLSHLGTMDEKHGNPIASEPGMNPLPLLSSAH